MIQHFHTVIFQHYLLNAFFYVPSYTERKRGTVTVKSHLTIERFCHMKFNMEFFHHHI